MTIEFQQRAGELIEAGRFMYAQGWVPATSGNFSARMADGRIAITVSGCHKGKLTEADILLVDANGRPPGDQRPSAETPLHAQLYRRSPETRAVLHAHSMNATLLSRVRHERLVLRDYELLKAFSGIDTHACEVTVPIFPNDQDIVGLAARIDAYMDAHGTPHGYLIGGHGFYTWGVGIEDALRHVEAFEFLFECEIRMQDMQPR